MGIGRMVSADPKEIGLLSVDVEFSTAGFPAFKEKADLKDLEKCVETEGLSASATTTLCLVVTISSGMHVVAAGIPKAEFLLNVRSGI